MKLICPLIFLVATMVPSAAEPAPQIATYPMREIPKEDPRFSRVLEAIRAALDTEALLSAAGSSVPTDSMIRRGISTTPVSVRAIKTPPVREDLRLKIKTLTVTQTVGAGEFLADLYGRQIHIVYKITQLVDGAQIRGSINLSSSKSYKYTDTLGAGRTVSSYVFTPDPDSDLTSEKLIDRLKSGASYTIKQGTITTICRACNGVGRVPITVGKRTGDGKMQCKDCLGAGKFVDPQFVRVVWDTAQVSPGLTQPRKADQPE